MKNTNRWALLAAAALVLAPGAASFADDPASSPPPSPALAASRPPAVGYSTTGTWQLLAKVNAHRRARGLRALALDPRLAAAARSWTERMVTMSTLSHNDALFSRTSHSSLRMKSLGENVGWNYSVAEQDAAFLHSPRHRANIETSAFRAAGFAVVRGADGRIWATEDFGTPSG